MKCAMCGIEDALGPGWHMIQVSTAAVTSGDPLSVAGSPLPEQFYCHDKTCRDDWFTTVANLPIPADVELT